MKSKMQLKKNFLSVGLVLFIAIFGFISLGAVSQTHAEQQSTSQATIMNYQEAQQNPDNSDEEKIKIAIDTYFTLRYEGQKLLQMQDYSALLEDNNSDWAKLEKDKREIEIYIASLYNTPYVSYRYSIDYDSIQINKNEALVKLRESNEVVTLPDYVTSKMGNLQHVFTLKNKNGEWKIFQDEYEDEISEGLKHNTKDELLKNVDENFNHKEQTITTSTIKSLASIVNKPHQLINRSYSGTLAKNYADQYWNTTNPPYYLWDNIGDCTNFVSQAIYAGEGKTPPNTSGMTTSPTRSYTSDWYYVWNNSGSVPWVQVEPQYDFITGNSSRIGPYGTGSSSYCDARVGDVIQISSDGSYWFHEGIVVAASTPCVGLQSIYIDAHDTNRKYMQLNGWSAYDMRVIRINGWLGNY